jgi:hypothetical protein
MSESPPPPPVHEIIAYVVKAVVNDTLQHNLTVTGFELNRTDMESDRWPSVVHDIIADLGIRGALCTIDEAASSENNFRIDVVWNRPPSPV